MGSFTVKVGEHAKMFTFLPIRILETHKHKFKVAEDKTHNIGR